MEPSARAAGAPLRGAAPAARTAPARETPSAPSSRRPRSAPSPSWSTAFVASAVVFDRQELQLRGSVILQIVQRVLLGAEEWTEMQPDRMRSLLLRAFEPYLELI